MKYRDILGFSKSKKKVVKEKSKPKKTVLDGVKQELNEWHHQPPSEKRWSKSFGGSGLTEHEKQLKEVGAGAEYRKYFKDIERQQKGLSKSVKNLQNFLVKQGLKDKAEELEEEYLLVSYKRMSKWLKQFIRSLM